MKHFFISFFVILSLQLIGQEKFKYRTDDYSLIGIINNNPAYILRDSSLLFNPVINKDLIITDFKKTDLEVDQKTYYINDSIEVRSFYNDKKTMISYGERNTTLDFYIPQIEVSYCADKNLLAFPVQKGNEAMIALHYLETDSTIVLPLIGWRPQISENYLYFSAKHIVKCGSSYLQNIYRVGINDWNNPELLVLGVQYYSWVLIPESDILYIRELNNEFAPNEYERYKNVLFNANSKSFETVDYEGSYKTTIHNGESFFAFSAREIRSEIISPYRLIPIKLTKDYPNKMKKTVVPCKGTNRYEVSDVINMPNKEKAFNGTFITEELLNSADETRLQRLTKNELRILRNAFFARVGYRFKCKDLQDFFENFDWYRELLDSNKTFKLSNADLVISPQDKKRVELIMEVEQEKK